MDNVYLTGPLGTQWNIGSWIDKTQGVDWGAHDLVRQQLNQTAFVEGARFAYETAAGARRMSFPLRVPSGGVTGLSLNAIEASLRQMVRPGAFVDIQPDGTATAEMVRFDVLGGDVAHHQYSVDLQRVGRREMTLSLQTQPFGYWPTWITLASVASVAPLPDVRFAVKAASVIGDVPAQARLVLNTGISVGSVNLSIPDFHAWSLSRASAPLVIAPNSSLVINNGSGTIAFDGSASWITGGASGGVWRASGAFGGIGNRTPIQIQLDSLAFGRNRVFVFARHGGGNAGTLRALADFDIGDRLGLAATGNVTATIPAVASLAGASYFGVYDLGELTLPYDASASTIGSWNGNLRVWFGGASDGSTATTILDVAGVLLLPMEGPAGIMSRGLAYPTSGAALGFFNGVYDSADRLFGLRDDTSIDPTHFAPVRGNGLAYYRAGAIGLPYIGGTDTTLQLMSFDRLTGTAIAGGGQPVRRNTVYLGYSLSYRPRFAFLKGI